MSRDTTWINQQMHHFDGAATVWLFGYGSLIHKADFSWLERRAATLRGWSRRFWQGSHDHRGTPQAPGRVVTLIPDRDAVCAGAAYLITPDVFSHLDHREKNGYLRQIVTIGLNDGRSAEGLTYIAPVSNDAFLGAASEAEIARQISGASGPSGSNRDYVFALANALRGMDETDDHVFAIEAQLRCLLDGTPAGASRDDGASFSADADTHRN